MNQAIGNAMQAVQVGTQRIEYSAVQIASAGHVNGTPESGAANIKALTESLVGMQNASQQTQAAVKVINAAGEMLGSVIDELG